MGIFTRINGVFRENKSNLVKINGVFRESSASVKINGVFRDVCKKDKQINVNDIRGFRLIYNLNKYKTHKDFPHLSYNKNIPYTISVSDDGTNMEPKSLLFEFGKNLFNQEGIICYDSDLYIFTEDALIPVSNISSIPTIDEVRRANVFKDIKIIINTSCRYELYGYHLYGWNNIFNGKYFEAHNSAYEIPLSPGGRKEVVKTKMQILPIVGRDSKYHPLCSIGIARDTRTPHKNMVGSRGILDHTIDSILVNGEKKPFQILYYD